MLKTYQKKLLLKQKWINMNETLKNRFFCLSWSLNMWFENFIYFFIMCAMIMLILDNPQLDPESEMARKMSKIDEVISLVFFVEAILRIGALGFINSSLPGKKGYIKSGQNKIDFFVCIVCDLTLIIAEKLGF